MESRNLLISIHKNIIFTDNTKIVMGSHNLIISIHKNIIFTDNTNILMEADNLPMSIHMCTGFWSKFSSIYLHSIFIRNAPFFDH